MPCRTPGGLSSTMARRPTPLVSEGGREWVGRLAERFLKGQNPLVRGGLPLWVENCPLVGVCITSGMTPQSKGHRGFCCLAGLRRPGEGDSPPHVVTTSVSLASAAGMLGERASRAQCLYNLASAHSQLGAHHKAWEHFQQAVDAFVEAGKSRGPLPSPLAKA